jgi:hypothetical protein
MPHSVDRGRIACRSAYRRGVRGDTRRETAELYVEMYEAGYNPGRGLGGVFVLLVLGFVVAVVSMMLMFTTPISIARDIAEGFFDRIGESISSAFD